MSLSFDGNLLRSCLADTGEGMVTAGEGMVTAGEGMVTADEEMVTAEEGMVTAGEVTETAAATEPPSESHSEPHSLAPSSRLCCQMITPLKGRSLAQRFSSEIVKFAKRKHRARPPWVAKILFKNKNCPMSIRTTVVGLCWRKNCERL